MSDDETSEVESSPGLRPGTPIGEYVVADKLGEGGFGAVYRAEHPLIGKQVAIKVLSKRHSDDPTVVSRFVGEARAVNEINHSHIVDVFGFGRLPDGRFYYVMELLDGEPLDRLIARQRWLTPEYALSVLAGIARALDAAHAKGIAHRDLKPDNVFLTHNQDGQTFPKLIDFGIAKVFGDSAARRTRTGAQIGTPYYMSPEQCRGQEVDHRTDIYSFGVMAFELLTGELPFDDESQMEVLMKHVQEAPPKVSERRRELHEALDAPIQRMMAKYPTKRPQSVGAAVRELAEAAQAAGYDVEPSALEIRTTPGSHTKLILEDAALARAETLVAQDDVATLSGDAVSTPPRAFRRAKLLAAVDVGLAAVLGVAIFATSSRAPAGVETPPSTAALTLDKPVEARTASSETRVAVERPAPTSTTVDVTITSVPANVTVFVGEEKLGSSPGPLSIPRGTEPVALTFKAKGHSPSTVDFTPNRDGIVDVELPKLVTRRARPTATKGGIDELEF